MIKLKVLFSVPYNLFAAMLGSFPKLVFWKTWIQIMRKIGICAFLRISQQVVLDSVMFKFYILRWKSFQEMFNLPRSLTITKESFFSHYFNDFSFCFFLKLAHGDFSWWLFFSTKICQYTWNEKKLNIL